MPDLTGRVTAFVITTGEPSTQDCIRRLQAQDVIVRIERIENVAPMWKALQAMIDRCETELYVQADADMLLEPHAISYLVRRMDAAPPNTAMHCAWLWGDAEEMPIQGVKIYRHDILKQFPYQDSLSCEMPQVKALEAAGYKMSSDPVPDQGGCLGLHFSLQTPEMAFSRWQRLMWKYRTRDYMDWFARYPSIWRDRWWRDPNNEIVEAAYLGCISGLCGALPPDSEADFRMSGQDYRRAKAHLGQWFSGPTELILYVTDRCNFHCDFCLRSIDAEMTAKSMDLAPAHVPQILDILPTVKTVCLAGFGEPLLHPGLGEIIGTCKARGCHVHLISNGALLIKRADEVESWKPDRLTVSLKGVTPEQSAIHGGSQSTFATILDGIRRLTSAGKVRIAISYVTNNATIDDVPRLFEIARELGVRAIDLPNLLPHGGNDDPEFLRNVIRASDVETLAKIAAARKLPGAELVEHWPVPIDPDVNPRRCESPFVSFGLDARGNFGGCRRIMTPDPRNGDYRQGLIWSHPYFVDLRRAMTGKGDLPEACKMCFGCWSG